MSRLTFILLLLLSPTIFVGAQYYEEDYDPDYLPYNFEDGLDNLDYEACENAIINFDSKYKENLNVYGTPVSVGGVLDSVYGPLKETTEEDIRQCLKDLRIEKQKEDIVNCNFSVIDSLSDEEIEAFGYSDDIDYEIVIEQCEIQEALDDCDFDFIKNFSAGDKVKYNKEIDNCEEELVEEEESEVITEEIIVETVKPETNNIEPIPINNSFSVDAPSVPSSPISDSSVNRVKTENLNEEKAPTSSDNKIEMTADEIEKMVEKRVEEALEKEKHTQIEKVDENVSIFKKVWMTIKSWFK